MLNNNYADTIKKRLFRAILVISVLFVYTGETKAEDGFGSESTYSFFESNDNNNYGQRSYSSSSSRREEPATYPVFSAQWPSFSAPFKSNSTFLSETEDPLGDPNIIGTGISTRSVDTPVGDSVLFMIVLSLLYGVWFFRKQRITKSGNHS